MGYSAIAAVSRSEAVQNLTIVSEHVATNCTFARKFRVAVTGNFTLDAPTGLQDSEMVLWEFTQTGAGGAITLAAAFSLPHSASAIVLVGVDLLSAIYHAASGKFRVVSYLPDYR